jgi:hypothetical protein
VSSEYGVLSTKDPMIDSNVQALYSKTCLFAVSAYFQSRKHYHRLGTASDTLAGVTIIIYSTIKCAAWSH